MKFELRLRECSDRFDSFYSWPFEGLSCLSKWGVMRVETNLWCWGFFACLHCALNDAVTDTVPEPRPSEGSR